MTPRANAGAPAELAPIETISSPPPPRTLADIPGLGPIRVRALQKAGWGDLRSLQSADLSALMTVPGLTEVKARHIQSFLQPFSPEDLDNSGLPTVSENGSAPHARIADGLALDEPSGAAAQLVQRATRAMGEVITILLSPQAPEFRSRFLRILGQFAQSAESLATDAAHLSSEQQARAIRRLRRAVKELSEFSGSATLDRKAQGRLADSLEELVQKLADCRLSS